jgi:hypothetical protein
VAIPAQAPAIAIVDYPFARMHCASVVTGFLGCNRMIAITLEKFRADHGQ